jgi:hypothetical protein
MDLRIRRSTKPGRRKNCAADMLRGRQYMGSKGRKSIGFSIVNHNEAYVRSRKNMSAKHMHAKMAVKSGAFMTKCANREEVRETHMKICARLSGRGAKERIS